MVTRRRTMLKENEWETLIHNFKSGYVIYKGSNNYTVEFRDDGESVEMISTGTNTNNSGVYTKPMFEYSKYKDKIVRLTWNIECDTPSDFSNGVANISISTYSKLNPTTIADGRVGKVDYATIANDKFLGYHQDIVLLSDIFANVNKSNYFGWNIGFRTPVNGTTIRITEFTLEVHK